MQLLTEQGYEEFIEAVAAGREKTSEEIDGIARGRVWIGSDALSRGLIDHLGGLEQSISAAAERADLGDDFRLLYLEQERDWRDQLLSWFVMRFGRWLGLDRPLGLELEGIEDLLSDLSGLERFGDPNGLYAYCFCEPN